MSSRQDKSVLRCAECGARAFEVRGALAEVSMVYCAECGTELGQVPQVLAELQARVARQIDKRRKRRLH